MISNIVVVGSGVMGRGIAYVSAVGGYSVTLIDLDESALQNAKKEIISLFEKSLNRGHISNELVLQAKRNLSYSTDLKRAGSQADLIIEAVPEKTEIKRGVFHNLEEYASDSCIFATNTSTMSPTEIASYAKRPEKTIAMHFFNPVHKMPLVEIVRGLETSDETVQLIKEVAEQMGKKSVVINEFPGFVTSRISALVGNEAFYMLQEGLGTPEEIDKAIKLGLNYPMGPFELVDLVGLDARLNNLKYLHEKLGEKYRPAPLLEQYVKAGRLGRKSGKGVYDYTNKPKEEVKK
ncbi:3-hydroxyacyl-CoA dehydrogenase [Priestia endophytica]|jgi:3-hydroxybutyryl-CoA dehydrogenase|uniref:3-hydroxybutyryl-CoA dehydrogenase n=2 Tax=Priestia endophytica TaxID=135735 RepID=A0AAX1QCI9_9BACI|nr:3-hydroxyacyl-CoA dehydrogenase [Priestia endophytica]KYG26146.1 3-hydroxybutyryl-CoA dehydrogenase [Priestia endophytica]MCM3537855.1 3-hydroxyacyl-CoA dehydrogenase [Priestia endophytica]RAS78660.1 3-hydroxybutyryl-CoA dehydrogenase [Priestia endophytica]RAS85478.1 3-hydroxybutyryl-CoA dehydrogenase [Priestia endophytica]SFQ78236.1 3-hydroxybutyryl-CoA dehydrogenase [Priestia endophytica DSM 13796]